MTSTPKKPLSIRDIVRIRASRRELLAAHRDRSHEIWPTDPPPELYPPKS